MLSSSDNIIMNVNSLKNKRFGILGMARSGIAAALKVLEYGGVVFISEKLPPEAVKEKVLPDYGYEVWNKLSNRCEFGCHTEKVLDNDYLIISPGIPLNIPIIKQAQQQNLKMISEIEFGYLIKAADSKIIAVTGSNGKSTTVCLINHLLKNAGYNTVLAGNIGNPLTSFPIEKYGIDYIVLELSSFQLELIDKFKADIAVLLNISADHLDRYPSMDEYIAAKLNIFNNQTANEIAILNSDDKHVVKQLAAINAKKLYFGVGEKPNQNRDVLNTCINANEGLGLRVESLGLDVLNTGTVLSNDLYYDNDCIVTNLSTPDSQHKILICKSDISLFGMHNMYNVMAAVLCTIDTLISENVLRKSLQTFQPLSHRLEKIAVKNRVTFVNDSKATNTDAVIKALTSFRTRVHIIMGGYDKGEDYTILTPFLNKHAQAVYLIGAAANNMFNAFNERLSIPIYKNNSLEEAVSKAYEAAEKDETVLLAPACASYDMFTSFEHRGDTFKQIVNCLEG